MNKQHTRNYGKLPAKLVIKNPWGLCVDFIGPYTLKGKAGTEIDITRIAIIDPASSWFEEVELPVSTNAVILMYTKGQRSNGPLSTISTLSYHTLTNHLQ